MKYVSKEVFVRRGSEAWSNAQDSRSLAGSCAHDY
jgi:hypothetical protein